MRISVIIASKDRAEYLDRALESLGKQIGAPLFEVIVVDNGSTDATPQIVDRARAQQAFDVVYVFEERPNRGAARNRGISVAKGQLIAFCDDDVYAPPGWLAAHDAAHDAENLIVNGPIVNVPSYHERPKPALANYSRAALCTCNVSIPRTALSAAGGFDEQFHLYGWEDTELGVRLSRAGLRSKFAWEAYIWHIKPPGEASLESEMRKALEKARMAVRFVQKDSSLRVRSATGAHPVNLLRARLLERMLPMYAGLATGEGVPGPLRALARSWLLDGIYTVELARALNAKA